MEIYVKISLISIFSLFSFSIMILSYELIYHIAAANTASDDVTH